MSSKQWVTGSIPVGRTILTSTTAFLKISEVPLLILGQKLANESITTLPCRKLPSASKFKLDGHRCRVHCTIAGRDYSPRFPCENRNEQGDVWGNH